MSGNGTLAIGMAHGDIFAAVRTTVPAGTGYASYLRGGFAPSPDFDATQAERDEWMRRAAGVGLPDPPVIVDFSSQLDGWAMTQPALLQGRTGWPPAPDPELGSNLATPHSHL